LSQRRAARTSSARFFDEGDGGRLVSGVQRGGLGRKEPAFQVGQGGGKGRWDLLRQRFRRKVERLADSAQGAGKTAKGGAAAFVERAGEGDDGFGGTGGQQVEYGQLAGVEFVKAVYNEQVQVAA